MIGKVYQTTPILNQSLTWGDLDVSVRTAFIGVGRKLWLAPGFCLYKTTEFDLMKPNNTATEWWSPVDPFQQDPGLDSRRSLARRLGAPLGDLLRAQAAVREDWNALTYLLTARLTQRVWGWYGQCSMQPRLSPNAQPRNGTPQGKLFRTANLPGYGWQFYIPNMTAKHVVRIAREDVSQP
jgi:hypothetical protein